MIESLLLTTARVSTFDGTRLLTGASGFFFERDKRLFFVTSRHVLRDLPTRHQPTRIEIELHEDPDNLTRSTMLSVPLYENGMGRWLEGRDGGGDVDVAVIEIDRRQLPAGVVLRSFTTAHLQASFAEVDVGSSLLIVGFPLGFHDTLHHLPVVRQAVIASSFGLRFQGEGYFLTDARTHRGTSGAPVVMRDVGAPGGLPWKLLGVHAARMDIGGRDLRLDESLGLNCAWYADILMTLTAPRAPAAEGPAAASRPVPATGPTPTAAAGAAAPAAAAPAETAAREAPAASAAPRIDPATVAGEATAAAHGLPTSPEPPPSAG